MKQLRAMLGGLVVATMASCTSGTGDADLTRDWKNPNYNGPKATKILTVVVSTDPGLREDLETDWVIKLVQREINATPSHKLIPSLKDVSREELEKLVASEGFDGVLVARPVTGSGSVSEHSNMVEWYASPSMYYTDLYGYWNEATIGVFTPTDAPRDTTEFLAVRFEANLYMTRGDTELVWTSEAKIRSSKESGEARKLYATRVLDALARHGLI